MVLSHQTLFKLGFKVHYSRFSLLWCPNEILPLTCLTDQSGLKITIKTISYAHLGNVLCLLVSYDHPNEFWHLEDHSNSRYNLLRCTKWFKPCMGSILDRRSQEPHKTLNQNPNYVLNITNSSNKAIKAQIWEDNHQFP